MKCKKEFSTTTLLVFLIAVYVLGSFFIGLAQANDEAIMKDLGLDGTAPQNAAYRTPSTQMIVYDGAPITIDLGVNQERRLQFQRPVEIGMAPELDAKLNVEIYGNNMLLTALEPFEERVQIRDLSTRTVVPVDVHAFHDLSPTTTKTVQVYTERPQHAIATTNETSNQITRLPSALLEPARKKPIDQVAMMRFAAQQYYAPDRLIEPITGAAFIEIDKNPVRLYRGDVVKTTPDAAWQIGGLTVTAVKVKNKTSERLVLDPRQLIGRWHSATFHHTVLEPKGGNDQTMVYLISRYSLEQALAPYARISTGEAS